jgi:WD40 repeat protein
MAVKSGLFLGFFWTCVALVLGLLVGVVAYPFIKGSSSGFLDLSGVVAVFIGFWPAVLLLVIGQWVNLVQRCKALVEPIRKVGIRVGVILWDGILVGTVVILVGMTVNPHYDPDQRYSRLGRMIIHGDVIALSKALDRGTDPNADGHDEREGYASLLAVCLNTHVVDAIGKDHQIEMAEMLLKRGADPNRMGGVRVLVGSVQVPAFWSAAECGNLDLLKLAGGHGALLDTRVQGKGSALNRAARLGFWNVATWLLDQGCDPNSEDTDGPEKDNPDLGGWTILEYAAWDGRLDIVNRLLASGVRAEPREKGNTALIVAARQHRVDVIKRLLASGADPLWRGNGTALDQAVKRFPSHHPIGSPDDEMTPQPEAMSVVETLLKAGAKVDEDLMVSAQEHGAALTLRLMKAGGSLNWLRQDGKRALTAACDHDTMNWLISHGADPNLPDALGVTALGRAEAQLEAARVRQDPDQIRTTLEEVEWLKARGARNPVVPHQDSLPNAVIQASDNPLPFAWGATSGESPSIALAWDGRNGALWSVNEQGVLQRWDPDSREGLIVANFEPPSCAALDPASNLALVGNREGQVGLYHLDTGEPVWKVRAHGGPVKQALLDPSRKRVYSVSSARTLCLQDLATGRRLASRGLDDAGRIALDPSGREIAVGLMRFTPDTLALTGFFGNPGSNATQPAGVLFLGSGLIRPGSGDRYPIVVGGYREVWVIGRDGRTIQLPHSPDAPSNLAADRKGRVLASLGGGVTVWDLDAGKALGSYYSSHPRIRDAAMAMDAQGRFLAISVDGGFQVIGPFQ